QRFVEPVGTTPALVGRQLHDPAAPAPALRDRPFQHGPTETAPAFRRCDADTLDLAPPHPEPRQPWDEGELQAADELVPTLDDGQQLVWIAVDRGEGFEIARVERHGRVVSLTPELVIDQAHDGWDIRGARPSKSRLHLQPDSRNRATVSRKDAPNEVMYER